MIKVYCGTCDKMQPIEYSNRWSTNINGEFFWIDVRCMECRLFFMTINVPIEGHYEFKKVGDVRERPGQA